MEVTFVEDQKFTQWWWWLLLCAILVIPLYSFIKEETFPDTTLVVLMGMVIVLFVILKLKTRIDSQGVKMSYVPFIYKNISWDEILEASIIDYGFVGGWGIRLWTKYGTVYNVRGKKGLFLELKNGKSFVIGTQKEEKLRDALKGLKKLNE